MKANEAPEKIYVDNPNHDFWYRTKNSNSIEYTRTDAFIEKACNWLLNNLKNYSTNELGAEYLIEDFKDYIKEE